MNFRTDLALERRQNIKEDIDGITVQTKNIKDSTITNIKVENEDAAKRLFKPIGEYITVEVPALTDNFFYNDEKIRMIASEIKRLIPKEGLV